MANIVAAAIDAGYGHTKWGIRANDAPARYGQFPSLTPQADGSDSRYKHLLVTPVHTNDKIFQIGPDSSSVGDGRYEARQRSDDYCKTDPYYALHLAALGEMGQPVIDVLVLGLPLSNFARYGAWLEGRFTGKHLVPQSGNPGKTTTVEVRRVHVMPQPGGALVAAATEHPTLLKCTNVVVDMGYFTLDYLVAEGQRPFPDRSGAVEGGMAGFYDELHRAADREYMDKYPEIDSQLAFNHSFYEQVLLRGQTVIKPGGSPVSLERPLQTAGRKLVEYLDGVRTGVGRTSDIENVILAGGGAAYLKPHLKERFKSLTSVITPPRPQLAIAEGFLTVAIGAARGASR